MDITKLTAELDTDPEGLGYVGMTAQQIADALNLSRKIGMRFRHLQSIEVLDTLGASAYATLCKNAAGTIEPKASNAKVVANYLRFAASAACIADGDTEAGLDIADGSEFRVALVAAGLGPSGLSALEAAAIENIMQSRAEVLGLPPVGDGHVRSCAGWEAK